MFLSIQNFIEPIPLIGAVVIPSARTTSFIPRRRRSENWENPANVLHICGYAPESITKVMVWSVSWVEGEFITYDFLSVIYLQVMPYGLTFAILFLRIDSSWSRSLSSLSASRSVRSTSGRDSILTWRAVDGTGAGVGVGAGRGAGLGEYLGYFPCL